MLPLGCRRANLFRAGEINGKENERAYMIDPYLQQEAEIVERVQDAPDIFTLRLRFTDSKVNQAYSFQPGQFNMLYLYGVGEVAISIVSNPDEHDLYSHTIRAVGKVTKGLELLQAGDRIGVRGPFGRGWPLESAKNKNVVIVTGGLGCAPVVAAINYIMLHRDQYKKVKIFPKSIFEFNRNQELVFDIILALNIFHHFLKRKNTYLNLIKLLERLEVKEFFFGAHKPSEFRNLKVYRNYTPDQFVNFIIENSHL